MGSRGFDTRDTTNRVALITGGTRGIGFAVAARLLEDRWAVCITARKAEGLADAAERLGHGDRLMTVQGKSDDPAHRADCVQAVVDRFGRLDVLVNNAGVNPVMGTMVELDESAARKILGVNVLACLGWAREMHRVFVGDGTGAIVNVSSYASVRPSPGIGMYGVSKAAVTQLTKQLALEMAPRIRVNAVIPALIETDFAGALYQDRKDEIAASYPLGRIGRPEDVASAIAFLASGQSAWITGETLLLDGGLSLTGGV